MPNRLAYFCDGMVEVKKAYLEYCSSSDRVLIFQTPLWLDAIVGADNWGVLLSFNGDLLCGAMPFVTSSKLGVKQITLPFLTPYLGPIVIYPIDLKDENQLSFKRKIIIDLVSQIPKVDRFITQTDFNFDYWLPFYWKGFQQTTRYSYLLSTELGLDLIYARFKPNVKKHIRNCELVFTIKEVDYIDDLYHLHASDLESKNIQIQFSKSDLLKLDMALKEKSKRKVIHALDAEGDVICAFYLVFDNTYCHYLIGAVNQNKRNSGVMSLMMWESIKTATKLGLTFNFEGSMNQNIERFFASFGGASTPYFQISQTQNKLLKQFTAFRH